MAACACTFYKRTDQAIINSGPASRPDFIYQGVEIDQSIKIYNRIKIFENKYKFDSLSIGDEFFVRYVPQSRYFQSQELDISGWTAPEQDIEK
jgi:hypothetical protein